jgi:predicted DNA-binding transcriptional regulator AlpA
MSILHWQGAEMNTDAQQHRLAFTVPEFAKAFGFSEGAVYRRAHNGELPSRNLFGRMLIVTPEGAEVIDALARRPTEPERAASAA